MSDLIADLKAALETKRERVRECEADLVAAKDDYNAFARTIVSELGIATIAPSGDRTAIARIRRDRVVELYGHGKTINEIAEELEVARALIDADMCKLRKQGRIDDKSAVVEVPASAPPGVRGNCDPRLTHRQEETGFQSLSPQEQRVHEFASRGMKSSDIANRLQISTGTVYTYLSQIRKKGLLKDDSTAAEEQPPLNADDDDQEAEARVEPDDDADQEDAAKEESLEGGDEATDEPSASRESLQAEVTRQQGGIRGKVVILGTTLVKKHRHTIRVDRMGDGGTASDGSGHVHRCYRFVLSQAHGHSHGATISP